MSGKIILVIDPDITVANLIKKSILGFDPTSTLLIVDDFKQAQQIFDSRTVNCVIADSFCIIDAGEDQFLNIIQKKTTDHELIITAYGDGFNRLSPSIKDLYPVISKPLDIQVFTETIHKIVGPMQTEIVQQASLSSKQYTYCQEILYKLRSSIGARCILLSDSVGRILISVGDTTGLSTELISSLLGGGIATLLEAGKELEDEGVIHLSYREGSLNDLYAVNIGKNILLVILIRKSPGYSKLGTAWYYARQSALSLSQYLYSTDEKSVEKVFDQSSTQAINDELDKLFN
jgi:hypothetical protein